MKGKGKCLCGSVELEVEYASNELGACHCSMCRNWSGGPMLVIDCADSVKISGESNVVRYKSSEWAERGFCGKCGTHLFYFLVPNNQYHLPVGLLMSGDDYKLT
ncbi:GFA family protein, partial [Vibrio sp. 10N.222.51.A6]